MIVLWWLFSNSCVATIARQTLRCQRTLPQCKRHRMVIQNGFCRCQRHWIEAETWDAMCLTLDLPIFQFRLQFKGWLPVVEHTCWRKAVINFKLTAAEREIFPLDHLISKFVIGQTGIRHGILPCQMWNSSFYLEGGFLLPLNSIKVFVRLFESCQSPWPTTVLTHQSQPSVLEGLDIDQRLVLKWWLHDPPVQHLPPVAIRSQQLDFDGGLAW